MQHRIEQERSSSLSIIAREAAYIGENSVFADLALSRGI
jgi:hypothetical protein